MLTTTKVTSRHLQRLAYLYVRQSTVHQVFEHTESTARQYALRERAVALGWPRERVLTIDSDQGQSGASAADRAGFQRLVAEVGLAHVGLVLGLEVSRLARSSADWHHLLELCAMTGTLILDEDGLYDPSSFNDRLLLGLKGSMSEAELHVMHARLLGALRSKAARGALRLPLPVGFVYAPDATVALDPDRQVQQAVRLCLATFRRTGSACQTVRIFREQGLLFPQRLRRGPHLGELVWGPLTHATVLRLLHNPCYCGAYVFGRTHTYKTADGRFHVENLPREEWHTILKDAHVGYLGWEAYEANLRQLHENGQAHGSERRLHPAREGPALLQGLVLCGWCGERMTVRYHNRKGQAVPDYVCQRAAIRRATAVCQRVPGKGVDAAIGELLVGAVTPLALGATLAVQEELTARVEESARLRQLQVERARYEAGLAQRRYWHVDPVNRFVADALEAEWNAKLQALAEAQEAAERQRQTDERVLQPKERAAILALATDFPRLWRDSNTPQRERKRMVRLLLEDFTLRMADDIAVHVRFKGGETQTPRVPLAPPIGERRRTDAAIVAELDRLLDAHTDGEVAQVLNRRGRRTFEGKAFTGDRVRQLRGHYGLADRFTRLRSAGLLTIREAAQAYDISTASLNRWRHEGRVAAYVYNDKGECLFAPPDELTAVKGAQDWARRGTLT